MINQPFKEVFINGEIKWWINHLPTIYQPFIGVLLMVFIDVYWVSHRDAVSSPWRLVRFGHHADPPQRPCFPRFPCFPRRWRRRETTSSASPRNMPYRSIDMETQRHKCIDIRYFYFESNEEEVNSRNKKEGEQLNLPINCMLFDSGHPKSSLGWFLIYIYIYVCVCVCILYMYILCIKLGKVTCSGTMSWSSEILMIRWFDDWLVIQPSLGSPAVAQTSAGGSRLTDSCMHLAMLPRSRITRIMCYTDVYICIYACIYVILCTWYSMWLCIYIYIHYIALHCIALRCIALHCITLHYITYITYIHYITLHYTTLHYITLHYIALHCIALHYITLHIYIYIYIYIGNYICTNFLTTWWTLGNIACIDLVGTSEVGNLLQNPKLSPLCFQSTKSTESSDIGVISQLAGVWIASAPSRGPGSCPSERWSPARPHSTWS